MKLIFPLLLISLSQSFGSEAECISCRKAVGLASQTLEHLNTDSIATSHQCGQASLNINVQIPKYCSSLREFMCDNKKIDDQKYSSLVRFHGNSLLKSSLEGILDEEKYLKVLEGDISLITDIEKEKIDDRHSNPDFIIEALIKSENRLWEEMKIDLDSLNKILLDTKKEFMTLISELNYSEEFKNIVHKQIEKLRFGNLEIYRDGWMKFMKEYTKVEDPKILNEAFLDIYPCGPYGQNFNAFVDFTTSVINFCPVNLIGSLARGNGLDDPRVRSSIVQTLAHEIAHILTSIETEQFREMLLPDYGVDDEIFASIEHGYDKCSAKPMKIKAIDKDGMFLDPTVFKSVWDKTRVEMISDQFGATINARLIKSLNLSKEENARIFSNGLIFCYEEGKETQISEYLRLGTHPPNDFRFQMIHKMPEVRELIGCSQSDTLSPSCTLDGPKTVTEDSQITPPLQFIDPTKP